MKTATLPDLSHDLLIDNRRERACPLLGAADDYDPLLELIGDARFVLDRRGVARHARVLPRTRPDHQAADPREGLQRRRRRGRLARRLSRQPLRPRPRRRRRGRSTPWRDSSDSRPGCGATPTCSTSSAGSATTTTRSRPGSPKVGFYGLDLYSLHASMAAVIAYLDKVDPEAAERARAPLRLLRPLRRRPPGLRLRRRLCTCGQTCENEVITQLVDLRRNAAEYALRDGRIAEDDYFYAEQNARLVRDAEQYYRTMYRGEVSSWNLRDRHMAETLEALVEFLDRSGPTAKVVVWAHNSHLGDARATQMGVRGEWNVGQLVRERYGRDAVLVGFTTYDGTVTAASNWDAPAERKRVRPALPGSYEALFHDVGLDRFLLHLRGPSSGRPGRAAAGACHRRDLPARHRAGQPLLPREPARPVRRRAPFRPDAGRRAARAHGRVGSSSPRCRKRFPSGV